MKLYKIILSGGGTGGHIYPAVAVAEALTRRFGVNVEILFVGAEGRMEMERVPTLGYKIEGLSIAGIRRSLAPKDILHNLLLPIKLLKSVLKARRIIKGYNADFVVGFGGYASAPVLFAAQSLGVPTLIQEQNSYAGITNKLLSRYAKRICVAYDGMERFFPSDRIVMTGNPLRGSFDSVSTLREEALSYFGLDSEKPIVLVVGGSLGTRTLNNMMKQNLDRIVAEGEVQVIWQTGKGYYNEIVEFMAGRDSKGVWFNAFIERMDYGYSVADLVVARSGACTVSELCLVGRATMFVPSPNVAEDHQTKNAMALVEKDAAVMIEDTKAENEGMQMAEELLKDKNRCKELAEAISSLAIDDSADRVVSEIVGLIK